MSDDPLARVGRTADLARIVVRDRDHAIRVAYDEHRIGVATLSAAAKMPVPEIVAILAVGVETGDVGV